MVIILYCTAVIKNLQPQTLKADTYPDPAHLIIALSYNQCKLLSACIFAAVTLVGEKIVHLMIQA